MFNITYQIKDTFYLSSYDKISDVMPEHTVIFNSKSGTVLDVHDKAGVIDVLIDETLHKVSIEQVKKKNAQESLVGTISIGKENTSVSVILCENIFRKTTDEGIVFYHEIPSVSSTLKNKIIYYCKNSKYNSEIEAFLSEIYDELTYDFLNISDYVEENIFKKIPTTL